MASIKKPACFSANKKACFSVLFPFAGGEASSVPISLFYSSGFLERGSEATGLPAAGAAFRPQGAPRVTRNKRRKRQRTDAPIEAAEGRAFFAPKEPDCQKSIEQTCGMQ